MPLPGQSLFSIDEVSARWIAAPHQVAQWAAQERLEVVTSVGPVHAGDEDVAGLVVVAMADLLPMFRRDGSGPASMRLRRLRKIGEREWRMVSDPADGVMVAAGDLLIDVAEMGRFEEENDLMRRAHAGKGPEPKYDWDAFWRAMAIYVHQHGVPPTLKELTAAMSNWFLDQSDGKSSPSDSVIRKKLSPLWNQLRSET
ncbi:hypothetical protein [Roseovarius autotrophicus]|uniref:hypothetical protein n=1 Tax=Roseovarius autotrophicus TaxID=2824121 RepID=UPI001B3736FF|nr:hypothetical protein [Roseovarius autotrophicus]